MGVGHLSGKCGRGVFDEASDGGYPSWNEYLYRAIGGGHCFGLLLYHVQMAACVDGFCRRGNCP